MSEVSTLVLVLLSQTTKTNQLCLEFANKNSLSTWAASAGAKSTATKVVLSGFIGSDKSLARNGVSKLANPTSGTIVKSLMRHMRTRLPAFNNSQSRGKRGREDRSSESVIPCSTAEIDRLAAELPDATAEQIDVIASVQELTMTSPQRVLALVSAVEYLEANRIAGSIVECGVWRGGSMSAVAKTLMNRGATSRDLWLYDTFEGMSEPTANDVDFLGQTADQLLQTHDRADQKSVWCCSPVEQVRQTMQQTGYPESRVHFVEGKVEETLPQTLPERIALLRLDTDWYESTRCELEYLFPRLVPGGVLIIDDYGHWEGCRRAVDEYFANHKVPMLLNRIDYTGRIGIYCPLTVQTGS